MCVFTPMYHVFLPQWEAASGKKKKHVYHYQGRTFLWISSRSPRKIYTVGKLLLVRCFCRLTLQQCWHKQTHCPISKYYKRIHRLIFQLFKCVFTLCHVFLPQWETSVSKKFTCSLFSRQDFFWISSRGPIKWLWANAFMSTTGSSWNRVDTNHRPISKQ